MSEAIEISKKYFSLSNEPNLEEISKLFTDNTIYNSKNTGNYLGVKNIISMQKKFYNDFNKINWVINTLEEINIGTVLIKFYFTGINKYGENINFIGSEYITVKKGQITEIEIF